jgi:SAM-dependent methyltransferase
MPRWDLQAEQTEKSRAQQAFVAGLIGALTTRAGRTSLLDVGCGAGRLHRALDQAGLLERIAYTGLDYGADVVSAARRALPGVEVLEGSIEALPCADASFDVVVAQGVLETLEAYEAALRELLRVAAWAALATLSRVGHGERGHGRSPGVGLYAATAWDPEELLRFARRNGASYAFPANRAGRDDAAANHVLVLLR